MRKAIFLTIFSGLLTFSTFSQSLTKEAEHSLDSTIWRFFDLSDWEHISPEVAFGGAPASAFLVLLSIDSSGKVSQVHLMSDYENKDSIFAIFSRLKPEVFKSWRSEACKGKIIIVPIAFASTHGDPTYVRDMMEDSFPHGDFNKVVITSKIVFGWSVKRSIFIGTFPKKKSVPK